MAFVKLASNDDARSRGAEQIVNRACGPQIMRNVQPNDDDRGDEEQHRHEQIFTAFRDDAIARMQQYENEPRERRCMEAPVPLGKMPCKPPHVASCTTIEAGEFRASAKGKWHDGHCCAIGASYSLHLA